MSKYGTIEFSGKSGKLYSFNVYTIDNEFRPYSAVYCITHRSSSEDSNGGAHDKIYFGSSKDISKELNAHQSSACFNSNQANCICTHREENEHSRHEILGDLIENYDPPCNQ